MVMPDTDQPPAMRRANAIVMLNFRPRPNGSSYKIIDRSESDAGCSPCCRNPVVICSGSPVPPTSGTLSRLTVQLYWACIRKPAEKRLFSSKLQLIEVDLAAGMRLVDLPPGLVRALALQWNIRLLHAGLVDVAGIL